MRQGSQLSVTFFLLSAASFTLTIFYAFELRVFDDFVVEVDKSKVILITNATKGFEDAHGGDINFMHCPQLSSNRKCEWTFSHNLSYLTTGDAVIFRPFAIHRGYHPPKYHPPNQKWIFHEVESAFRSWKPHRSAMKFWKSFNASILYTKNADITYSADAFQCKIDPEYKKKSPFDFNYIRNKTGGVLWIASNCRDTSGREYYIEEMQKSIHIDVYGKCGRRRVCGKYWDLRIKCLKRFIGTYKFYLAFENSFCTDYYTEKLTRLIGVDTIPVVMGLVNYTSILTPGTFIDVRDFSSVKALTEHLHYLANNDTAYHEIIERKRSTRCNMTYPRNYFCQLCHFLHENKNRIQTIPDPRGFWGSKHQCKSRHSFFKGIANDLIKRQKKKVKF